MRRATLCPCCRRTPDEHARPKFVIECRKKDGTLLLRDADDKPVPQPPLSPAGTLEWTENEITDYFFRNAPKERKTESDFGHGETASMEVIAAWFAERNWYWRRKTW